MIDYVSCTGNEQFLANCTNHGIGITSTSCSHAGVQCPGTILKILDLGLVILQIVSIECQHSNITLLKMGKWKKLKCGNRSTEVRRKAAYWCLVSY